MNTKANYVRQHGDHDDSHTCHWPGCDRAVPPAMWGCRTHWYRLPLDLRNRIWMTFRPGQEIDKHPSEAYLKVAKEVQEWIASHYPPPVGG